MVPGFRHAPTFMCCQQSMDLHLFSSLPSLCVICVCRWDFGEIPGLAGDKSAYIECLSLVALL